MKRTLFGDEGVSGLLVLIASKGLLKLSRERSAFSRGASADKSDAVVKMGSESEATDEYDPAIGALLTEDRVDSKVGLGSTGTGAGEGDLSLSAA